MLSKTYSKITIGVFFLLLPSLAAAYDLNDFATGYYFDSTGSGTHHKNPETALGRPTVDILYYGAVRPVVPVFAASSSDDVVSISKGGYLILEFNHKVADDINNPYGIDFIVFGNSWQMLGLGQEWDYSDPEQTTINTSIVYSDPGIISVSQGISDSGDPADFVWYTFDTSDPNIPAVDDFPPTLGRIYDPENPYNGFSGWDNRWWADETDPTIPLDPAITPEDFQGLTLAQVCTIYGKSAGGAGYDLRRLSEHDYNALQTDPVTGRKWIRYIKIECPDPDNIIKPEIDAVADVSACGDYKHPFPPGDLNNDGKVDFADLALISSNWLECTWKCSK